MKYRSVKLEIRIEINLEHFCSNFLFGCFLTSPYLLFNYVLILFTTLCYFFTTFSSLLLFYYLFFFVTFLLPFLLCYFFQPPREFFRWVLNSAAVILTLLFPYSSIHFHTDLTMTIFLPLLLSIFTVSSSSIVRISPSSRPYSSIASISPRSSLSLTAGLPKQTET